MMLVILLGVAGVLVGASLLGTARPNSRQEFAGAVLVLASVLAIPAAAILAAL